MEQKSQRGGPGRGQGRKLKDPAAGHRQTISVRLRPDTLESLEGRDRTALIERGLAITIPALGHPRPGTDECLLAYYAISEAIQSLERRRDSGGEDECLWTDEEARLHALLNHFWDELRSQPTFWEPELPE